MLNYEVDPAILAPFLPAGTELDDWHGKTFVSIVAFLFRNTRFGKFFVPFHRDFEEINLRFYVKRAAPDGQRRGVVFIKEIVPRWAIAWTARTFYNESYVALPMSHRIIRGAHGELSEFSCEWKLNGEPNRLALTVEGDPSPIQAGSQEEFITEHYWGYARQRDGGTVEYHVDHPKWKVWNAKSIDLHCNAIALYGPQLAKYLNNPPASAFLADGSPVTVFKGQRIA